MPREAKQEHLGAFFNNEIITVRQALQAGSRTDLSGTAELIVYEPTGSGIVAMDGAEAVGANYAEFTLTFAGVAPADGYRAKFTITLSGGNVLVCQYTFDLKAVYP